MQPPDHARTTRAIAALIACVLLLMLTLHQSRASPSRPLIGAIQDHADGDTTEVTGWACDAQGSLPATVKLFRAAPPGTSGAVYVASSTATLPSADADAIRACGSARIAFRFLVPPALRQAHPAERLYVQANAKADQEGRSSILQGFARIHASHLFFVPTGNGADEAAPIRDALNLAAAAAAKFGAGEVMLSPGVHHVSACTVPIGGQSACFGLVNPSDGKLIFGGAGRRSEIIVHAIGASTFFSTARTQNLYLMDFSIDYATPGFTQGIIRAVKAPDASLPASQQQTLIDVDFDRDPQFPTIGAFCGLPAEAQPASFMHHKQWSYIAQRDPPGLKKDTPSFWWPSSCEHLPGGDSHAFRLHMHRFFARFARPGDLYLQLVTSGYPVMSFVDTENITLDNVSIFGGHGAATVWVRNTGFIRLDHVTVGFDGPSKRLMTTAADGFIALGNWAPISITHSSFEGMSDEAINIHALGCLVASQPRPTDTSFLITGKEVRNCAPFFHIGDLVQIVSPVDAIIKGEARIVALAFDPALKQTRITLDRPIPGVVTGTLPGTEKTYSADVVYNISASSPGSVIAHNRFGRFRGSAIADRSEGSTIEDNVFANGAGPAISFSQRLAATEGPVPSHIRVLNNRISAGDVPPAGFGRNFAQIDLVTEAFAGKPKDGPDDILFSGNQITDLMGAAFAISGAGIVKIHDTRLSVDAAASPTPLISVAAARNVAISSLVVHDLRENHTPPVSSDGSRVEVIGLDVDPPR